MKRLAIVTGALLVLAAAPGGRAENVRRVIPENRPYIVEIGEPQPIDVGRLNREMTRNTDLREFILYFGYPDIAEVQEIRPEAPWEPYEVRVYYLRQDLQAAFGNAYFAPGIQAYGIVKYEGPLRAEDLTRLASAPRLCAAGGPKSDAMARVMSAADRAAQAAERAEADSAAAAKSAERAASTVERMEASFVNNLRK